MGVSAPVTSLLLNSKDLCQSVEIRFGKEGSKAKWVRIALRKVEMLPGGAQAAGSIDYIGQSPQDIWVAPGNDFEEFVAVSYLVLTSAPP